MDKEELKELMHSMKSYWRLVESGKFDKKDYDGIAKEIIKMDKKLTKENITEEDVIQLYKDNLFRVMDNKLNGELESTFVEDDVLDELADTLELTKKEDGSWRIPYELKWIEEALAKPLDDYPVLAWKSEVVKKKVATLDKFFDEKKEKITGNFNKE